MRITEAEKLEAYQLAMHELIGVMANVQNWVRLAQMGAADLMDPVVLENLADTVTGKKACEAMEPIATYQKRQIEERRRRREEEKRE